MKYFCYILLLTLMMVSCVDKYDADLPASDSQLLVVDGTIISDSLCTFYLSLTSPLNSTDVNNINDATISLKGSDGLIVTGQHTADGTYQIDIPALDSQTQYSIVVNYAGDTYLSDAQYPVATTAINALEGNQTTASSPIDFLITTDVPANTAEIQYYRWTYDETWEVKPDKTSQWYWEPNSKAARESRTAIYPLRGWKSDTSADIVASSSAYYSNNQIVKYKLYDVPRSDSRFFVLYSTEVTQRSLSKEEYEYETERKKISTEMGGLFTPQPSSLPTNIHCTTSGKRALGFVGCALNVARYRLFVNSTMFSIERPAVEEDIVSTDKDYPGEETMYSRGYQLHLYVSYPETATQLEKKIYYWTSLSSLDIRLQTGVSLEKPSYWPN